ncbi:MAG: hypothetical protein AAF497_05610 [Planctomycetota bacterium]
MPYEIHLIRFDEGRAVEADSDAVREAFSRHAITEFATPCYLTTPDGVTFELDAGSLDAGEPLIGVVFTFRSLSLGLTEIVYDVAVAGDFTIILVDNPSIPLVLCSENARNLPQQSDLADPVVCRSASDIAEQLEPRFSTWQSWAYPDSQA